ncbi:hypothetical protein L218DRAFT_976530 [Marasmius fiardii PR-910]|nr:hypothetical protein L218DRAFT_976530 [Marasmius fiardii PR-910]
MSIFEVLVATGRSSDGEAQALVIASLRSQVQDLYTQVTQLNNKLVKSYDRVSDLEDDLHVTSANLRSSSLRISQLELERTQHLSALNTGLLVEKSQVTAELTRLMEKATEEAAQRGQAESARAAIEKDLDDLSASLFDQANTMVAEARYARSLSEQKVITAEQALKGAEEAVAIMQQQMQDFQAEKEISEKKMQEMQVTMGKGKWSERQSNGQLARSARLLSSHTPYQEFLLFVAHLRSVHPASPQQPPAMTTLLPLPFISRLMTEDSDPTLRLDFAPSLNWLSRRSVLAAIHSGQLTIEPMAATMLLQESQSIPGLGNNTVTCALCGVPIFPSSHLLPSQNRINLALPNPSAAWSTSLFKRPLNGSATNSPPPSPRSGKVDPDNLPSQVHIFRPPQHPTNPHHTSTIYPLCTSGWCLLRLRATCSLWAFVWEEEVPNLPPLPETSTTGTAAKRRGLWGMATALQERAASWGSEGDKDKIKKEKEKEKKTAAPPPPKTPTKEKLSTGSPVVPPPVHPVISKLNTNNATPSPNSAAGVLTSSPTTTNDAPPPLPKRNEGRGRSNRQKEIPETPHSPHTPNEDKDLHGEGSSTFNKPGEGTVSETSPLRIPLPESRPGTPGTPVPPPVVPVPVGTSTPPPVPARAMARGPRPMRLPPGSRPVTPTPAAPASISNAEEGGKVMKADNETEKVKETGKETKAEGSEEKGANEAETVQEAPIPTSTAEGLEKAPVVSEADGSAEVEVEEKRKSVGTSEPSETAPATTGPSEGEVGNGIVSEGESGSRNLATEEEAQAQTTSDSPQVAAEEAERKESEKAISDSSKETEKEAETTQEKREEKKQDVDANTEKEKDRGVYIGDATWEERTWKEVVRLKEVMFWARIGGLRD